MPGPKKRIGYRSYDEVEVEPLKQINNTPEENKEEVEEESTGTVMLNDYIPGAIYDEQGNIITNELFRANLKKVKAETRNLNWQALARLILYSGIGISVLLLASGVSKKYLQVPKNPVATVVNSEQKTR